MRLLKQAAFNVGCYTLSVVGQVLHYRTWLFHNVKTHKTLSHVMDISGILQALFGALCVICVFAKCNPVEGNWDPTVEAKCWDESVFLGINYTSSAITCTCGLAFMSHKMLSMAEPIQHLSSANHSNSHSFESVWALFSLTPILSST